MDGYDWDDDHRAATRSSAGGVTIRLTANAPAQEIDLRINWTSTGLENWRHRVPIEKIRTTLSSGLWKDVSQDISHGYVNLSAVIDQESCIASMGKVARALDQVADLIHPKG